MGKKSLTKSTAKKKSSTAAKKKNPKTKTAGSSTKETSTKKTATRSKSKKPTLKSLRKKQFESWSPQQLFVPEPDPGMEKAFTAPAVTDDYDPGAAEEIKSLLQKQIDLTSPEPVPKAVPSVREKAKDPAESEPEAEKKMETETKAEDKPLEKEAEAKTDTKAEQKPEPEKPAEQKQEKKPEPEKKQPASEKMEKQPQKTEKTEPDAKSDKSTPKKTSDNGGEKGGPPQPPEPPKPPEAVKKEFPVGPKLMVLIAAGVLVFLLIIGASFSNMGKYYLKQTDSALEIWQGKFSPRGKQRILTLPGGKAPETQKKIYSKKEALIPAFNYYMDKADSLTEAEDSLDFQAIKEYLIEARQYAVTSEQKQRVNQRLERMDFLMLLYKADIAAEKNTIESLESALDFLGQAAELNIGEQSLQPFKNRIAEISKDKEALEKAARAAAEEKKAAKEAKKAETENEKGQTAQEGADTKKADTEKQTDN